MSPENTQTLQTLLIGAVVVIVPALQILILAYIRYKTEQVNLLRSDMKVQHNQTVQTVTNVIKNGINDSINKAITDASRTTPSIGGTNG